MPYEINWDFKLEMDILAASIAKKIPYPAQLEMLAEECNELAAVVLKRARLYREDNPTPASAAELDMDIAEEWGDVLNAVEVLGIVPRSSLRIHKMRRWKTRIEEAEEEMNK